jgi:hypothetical protein
LYFPFFGFGYSVNPFTFTAHFFEFFQIFAEDGMRLYAVLQTAQLKVKFRGWPLWQSVDHPFFVTPRDHQVVGAQVGQVLGNGHLGQP